MVAMAPSVLISFTTWLFARPPGTSGWQVLMWWEKRRVPFNIVIGTYGVLSLLIFFWALSSSGQLMPGEDAVEPMALLLAPFGINMLYTLGWLVEIPARSLLPGLPLSFGPVLLRVGLALGLFFSTLPAAFWVAYRLLQMAGVVT